MGRRSDFEKIPKGKYYTWDERAGIALRPFIEEGATCIEPCAGSGDLIDQIKYLNWQRASDIEPTKDHIEQKNALSYTNEDLIGIDYIVTNPDWDRKFLHPAIEHFASKIPTWFLIDAPWLFNKSSGYYVNKYLTDVVPIGRLKWIRNTTMSAKDDCIWACFRPDKSEPTRFFGRE